jgi:hypothetical protein
MSHMVWGMCRSIHNDIFTAVKWGVEKTCSADEGQKLVNFWITFVEPFFGLPHRAAEELQVLYSRPRKVC